MHLVVSRWFLNVVSKLLVLLWLRVAGQNGRAHAIGTLNLDSLFGNEKTRVSSFQRTLAALAATMGPKVTASPFSSTKTLFARPTHDWHISSMRFDEEEKSRAHILVYRRRREKRFDGCQFREHQLHQQRQREKAILFFRLCRW